jgi:hypothetical protein
MSLSWRPCLGLLLPTHPWWPAEPAARTTQAVNLAKMEKKTAMLAAREAIF